MGRESVSWGERGRSDRMWHVVAVVFCSRVFVREVTGRCSVRVSCCNSQAVVVVNCADGIVRAYRGVNGDVAIECGV